MKCPLCGTNEAVLEAASYSIPAPDDAERYIRTGDLTLRFACGAKLEIPLRPWLKHDVTFTFDDGGRFTVEPEPEDLGMVRALVARLEAA